MAERRIDFCTECRKDTAYTLKKRSIKKIVRGKEYIFNITSAFCDVCGAEMNLPGLIDKNIHEVDEQYRSAEGIVTVYDIKKIMEIYKIGKAPLSLALGFGEVTITRYLTGQIPSKDYSDVLKKALTSPAFMKKKLEENKDKIAATAYNKAFEAATQLENLFSVSDKMLRVIACLFERLREVTPLMLQKLLYFTQGLSLALNDAAMFEEDCQAWVHGPVYPEVYEMFKDFKYNPIEDARFAIFEGSVDALIPNERRIIELVVNTFGEYSGRILERITHSEMPWKTARVGYGDKIPSSEPITKESIKNYYSAMNEKYDFSSEDGIRSYIKVVLQ